MTFSRLKKYDYRTLENKKRVTEGNVFRVTLKRLVNGKKPYFTRELKLRFPPNGEFNGKLPREVNKFREKKRDLRVETDEKRYRLTVRKQG